MLNRRDRRAFARKVSRDPDERRQIVAGLRAMTPYRKPEEDVKPPVEGER